MAIDLDTLPSVINQYYLGLVSLAEVDVAMGSATLADLVAVYFKSNNILFYKNFVFFLRAISKNQPNLKCWLLTPQLVGVYCFNLSQTDALNKLTELIS